MPSLIIRFQLLLAAAFLLSQVVLTAATYTSPRALNVGDIYDLRRDGWVNQSPSGYEGDVQPKIDENLGTSNDSPYYRRHNVARAWATGTGYWFTDGDQFPGEPAPTDEQWVDYVPPFEILGPGRYSIEIGYRWAASRASYPAVYTVHHLRGSNTTHQSQRTGVAGSSIVYAALGQFEMVPGSFVRVQDTGSESITFGNGRFRLIEPHPKLEATISDGVCRLRWSTNSVGYALECTATPADPISWFPLSDIPGIEAGHLVLSVPMFDEQKYFRLVRP